MSLSLEKILSEIEQLTPEEQLMVMGHLVECIKKRLKNSKIVTLEIDSPQTDNPWMKVAGMYKDNPLFDEVLAEIEAERRQVDAEMEEYYRQNDTESEVK